MTLRRFIAPFAIQFTSAKHLAKAQKKGGHSAALLRNAIRRLLAFGFFDCHRFISPYRFEIEEQ